ncbi:MAG: hypothetical protein WC803_07995 [Sphingomonas sp.]|jgi:hypothetical protein
MKQNLLLSAAALLLLPLAACDNKPETVTTTAPDPMAAELANSTKVELPPAMKASVTFRCKDNSLVFVDFFAGDKQVNLRPEKDAPPIKLTAPNAGEPMTAEGYSLTGSPKAITLTQPNKGTLTCKA